MLNNKKMFEKLRAQDGVEFYEFKDIPVNCDSFVISDRQVNILENKYLELLNTDSNDHPNNHLKYCWCTLTDIESLDGKEYKYLEIHLEDSGRVRGVIKTRISEEDITASLEAYTCGDRPYLVLKETVIIQLKDDLLNLLAKTDWVDK